MSETHLREFYGRYIAALNARKFDRMVEGEGRSGGGPLKGGAKLCARRVCSTNLPLRPYGKHEPIGAHALAVGLRCGITEQGYTAPH